MTTTEKILETIIAEFPMYRREITVSFYKSENFIEICEDYVLCLEAIKELESMNNLKRDKEINDLKLVMTEFKEELLSMI